MTRLLRGRRQVAELERLVASTEARLDELNETVTRLAVAFDALPVGVVVRNADGVELVRNRALRIGIGDRQGDALLARAVDDVLTVSADGSHHQVLELHQPRRSFGITGEPLPGGGSVAVAEDISTRRQLDAVRRDFVANVSHELRTPIGALAVLTETLAGEDDMTVVRKLARRMAVEADRASQLVEDLLDLSRVEAATILRREPIKVRRMVLAAFTSVDDTARNRNIAVDCEDVPGDLEVVGDEAQLVSALRNLLENAVKYTGDGGHVSVRARREGATIAVSVRDDGIGIPSRDLDRIFERFYRVDRARSRATGGTGLGLAIVRHVANNHGGDVSVESVEGVGSTFTLRILAEESAPESRAGGVTSEHAR